MMRRVLYISMTGMTEPLGESQVLQYLLNLASDHEIYLLSFEKPCPKDIILATEKRLKQHHICWHYFMYSNRFGIVTTAWQILLSLFLLAKWIKKYNIQIIHARSFIPGVIGLLCKKIYRIKLLFDIRGFAIDEKIMDGRLKEQSFLTRILKKLEARLYQSSDHIVTLTHASKPI